VKKVFVIDGNRFDDLEGFYDVVSTVLIPNARWGRNLDAFEDIFCGGFGLPREGYVVRWINVEASRQKLGYQATVHKLREDLKRCHPESTAHVMRAIADAESETGQTLFDILIEILQDGSHRCLNSDAGLEFEFN
jgi:RNAse (barnase) inhibitor barstar